MSQSALSVYLRTGVGKVFQALALTFFPVRGALLQALAASYLLTWNVAFVCFEYYLISSSFFKAYESNKGWT